MAGTGIGDLAEYVDMTPGETFTPGDILVPDPDNPGHFIVSNQPYTQSVAGIISETAQFIIGAGLDAEGKPRAPLSLSGLVHVNVTDENGPIKVGDYLVTASVPGKAMRFDPSQNQQASIIGLALEPFDQEDGRVKMLITTGINLNSQTTSSTQNTPIPSPTGGLIPLTYDTILPGLTILSSSTNELVSSTHDVVKQLSAISSQRSALSSTIDHIGIRLTNAEQTQPSTSYNLPPTTYHLQPTTSPINGLSITGPTTLHGGLAIDSLGLPNTQTQILSDPTFLGTPYFNSNTGGFVIMSSGTQSANITFTQPYHTTPVVGVKIVFEHPSSTEFLPTISTIWSPIPPPPALPFASTNLLPLTLGLSDGGGGGRVI